jgi:hypothetical protein
MRGGYAAIGPSGDMRALSADELAHVRGLVQRAGIDFTRYRALR